MSTTVAHQEMIRVQNPKKSFSSNEVQKVINLTVKQGEVVVLIGASGSGKEAKKEALQLLVKNRTFGKSGHVTIDFVRRFEYSKITIS